METIRGCDLLEKQSVARHGIVNARAGENQPVITTKRGNHDRRSHAQRARMTEHGVHHRHRHAILRRVLDFRKRQYGQVSKVGQQIKGDHNRAAAHERAHQIFSRIAHFAADKCDICPGGLSEQRTDHRFSKKQRHGKSTDERKTRLGNLRLPTVRPRIPPSRTPRRAGCVPA